MSMNEQTKLRIALITDICRILAYLSFIIGSILIIIGMMSGFEDWHKDYLLYSGISLGFFFVVYRICKTLI
jgi:hypothetical protein